MNLIEMLLWIELIGVLLYGWYVISQKKSPIPTDGWVYIAAVFVVSLVWFVWIPMKAFNTFMKSRKAAA